MKKRCSWWFVCPREAETGFPPSEKPAEAGRGVSGASRGEFGSRAGLWHEAEPRAERWRREIYCKVQHLSSAVQRPPPDSDPVNLFRSDSFKHAALRAAVQHTWRTVHTTERPSAKQPVTWPNIFLDTICYIFSSLWTQSFPHENFPIHSFIHSFVYLNTLFPTFVLIKVSAFCPVSIFWTEWGFLFLFSSNTIMNI